MTDPLRQRVLRALETLPDERVLQVLDYVEFLESRYAARARPDNVIARLVDTVGDTMRATKVPIQTITGTLGAIESAQKLMQGLAAAGEAVLDEMQRAAVPPAGGTTRASAAPAGTLPAGTPPAGTLPPAPPAGTVPPSAETPLAGGPQPPAGTLPPPAGTQPPPAP